MGTKKSKPSQSEAEHLRDAVAREVFARAERDRERVESPQIKQFLAYVVAHLFERDFSVGNARKECKLMDRSFIHSFKAALGESPSGYSRSLRLEVVSRLLTETKLTQDEIAAVVGLSAGSALRNAFAQGTGETIKQFRDRCRNQQHRESLFDKRLGQRLRDGALSAAEANDLFAKLQADYAELGGERQELRFCPGDGYMPPGGVSLAQFERLAAQVLWNEVEGRPLVEQLAGIRQGRSFKTTGFIDLLQHKIIEVGRLDRSRGVEVARLALTAAFDFEVLDPSARSELRGRAWSWLGNALRLNLELVEAERAMVQAEAYLPEDSGGRTLGEVLLHKAALCWSRRQHKAGLKVAERSLALIEKTQDRELLAKILMIYGLLSECCGKAELAAERYSRALGLFADQPGSEMACFALHYLAWSSCLLGDHKQARQRVLEFRKWMTEASSRYLHLSIDWLEGRLALETNLYETAIELLNRARSSFQSLNSNLSALVGLDLAISYLQSRVPKRAIQLAREALPILAVWRDEPEFQQAFNQFEFALRNDKITLDSLVRIRDLSHRLRSDSTDRFLSQLKGIS